MRGENLAVPLYHPSRISLVAVAHRLQLPSSPLLLPPPRYQSSPDPHVANPDRWPFRAPDHPNLRRETCQSRARPGFVTRPCLCLAVGERVRIATIGRSRHMPLNRLHQSIPTCNDTLGTDHSRKITSSVPRSTFPRLNKRAHPGFCVRGPASSPPMQGKKEKKFSRNCVQRSTETNKKKRTFRRPWVWKPIGSRRAVHWT